MMIQEFTALTKYEPTYEEYVKDIEPIYTEFDGDKYQFCKAWSKLFKHKIKNQLMDKKFWEEAPIILQIVYDTDHGYMVNEKVWAYANIGLKLLANMDRGYIDVYGLEKGICEGLHYHVGYEGWHVYITYNLHSVEFDKETAKRVIKWIISSEEIKSAYEYAKKVRKGKKVA